MSPSRPRAILGAFAALTTIATVGQTYWAIGQDRRLTLEAERANEVLAARLLEEHAHQQLQAAAQRLDIVATGAAAIMQPAPLQDRQIRGVIEDTLKNSRAAGALQFVNPDGLRWASLIDFPGYVINSEKREYIALLLRRPGDKGLVVGRPLQRQIDGELVLPLARNLYDYQGRYAGLVSTEVSLSYFNRVYEQAANNSQAAIELLSDGGFVIVRSPFDPGAVNRDLSMAPLGRAPWGSRTEGALEERSLFNDNQPRLTVFRRIDGFPVTIIFGKKISAILANWQARTADRITVSGLFIAVYFLLTYYLLRHTGKLQRSERMLRDSEAKFVDLFQRAPIPLALIRQDNDTLVEANDAILAQFGYTRSEFIGRTPIELGMWVRPRERSAYIDSLLRQHFVDAHEVQLRHKDGSIATCLLSTRLIDSAGVKVGIFSPNDVSHQRQVEREIRILNAQLEYRVHERTENMEKALSTVRGMQSELVRSEKMAALGSLVAGIAHELNTPIGNSVTVASTMYEHVLAMQDEMRQPRPRRSMLDQLSGAMLTGTDIMMRNLRRAAALVTSFKQIAVDQSSDQRRVFDLAGLADELALTLEPMYKNKHTLNLSIPAGLRLDSFPGALTQVLTNFVSNSLNHGFEDRGHGTMHLRAKALGGEEVQLSFSDDGRGIAPEHLGRVFDPFFTTKLGQGGSGLGMHIVYNLVTGVLGGKVSVSSAYGTGTTVSLVLPLRAPDRAPTAAQPARG